MEIIENHLKCLEKIFSESLYATLEREHPDKGWAMPLISNYQGKKYILTPEYSEKYMPSDEYREFYRKRSFEELINDGAYVEYKGINFDKILKESKDKPFDPEDPLKDWTKEAHIDIKTVHYD